MLLLQKHLWDSIQTQLLIQADPPQNTHYYFLRDFKKSWHLRTNHIFTCKFCALLIGMPAGNNREKGQTRLKPTSPTQGQYLNGYAHYYRSIPGEYVQSIFTQSISCFTIRNKMNCEQHGFNFYSSLCFFHSLICSPKALRFKPVQFLTLSSAHLKTHNTPTFHHFSTIGEIKNTWGV